VAGSPFGTQNGLSRIKRLSFTALLLLERNSFAASVTNEERTALTNSVNFLGNTVGTGTSSNSVTTSLSWQHDLSRATSLSTNLAYTVSDNGALLGNASAGSQSTISASASLGHSFTETLSGNVSYYYTERSGGAGNNIPASFGGNATQNTFLVGVRKSF
jgi:hypothetical protein